MIEIDAIKRSLLTTLGETPTIQFRRGVARALRQLAMEQDRIADAEERDRRKAPQERRKRVPGGLRGRQPGKFIRIERRVEHERTRLWVYVGKQLYRDIGTPDRVDIRRGPGNSGLRLVPITDDTGYKVQVGTGMPRFRADGMAMLRHLEDGRYNAIVRGNELEIGALLLEA